MITSALPQIGFIGAGKVGGTLARALDRAGYPVVAISSRRLSSAEALAAQLSAAAAFAKPQDVVDRADLVFITTFDAAIREVVAALRWREGVAVIHTGGAETREVLSTAAEQGAATASLHPLQTFADPGQALANLPGTVFGLEAEGALRDTLLVLVRAIGGSAIELRAEDKALYHASAVLASNYVVTLMDLATRLWASFGVDRETALRALLPLLRGAVNNLESVGLPDALTGPIARGDIDTVRRHLDALATDAPEVVLAYKALGLQTLPIAVERGGLSQDGADQLRCLLEAEDTSVPEGTVTTR